MHIFFADTYAVTIHHGPCSVLDDVRQRIGHHHASEANAPHIVLVYLIVDALTDSFFPVLSAFDERIDTSRTPSWSSPPRTSSARSSP